MKLSLLSENNNTSKAINAISKNYYSFRNAAIRKISTIGPFSDPWICKQVSDLIAKYLNSNGIEANVIGRQDDHCQVATDDFIVDGSNHQFVGYTDISDLKLPKKLEKYLNKHGVKQLMHLSIALDNVEYGRNRNEDDYGTNISDNDFMDDIEQQEALRNMPKQYIQLLRDKMLPFYLKIVPNTQKTRHIKGPIYLGD